MGCGGCCSPAEYAAAAAARALNGVGLTGATGGDPSISLAAIRLVAAAGWCCRNELMDVGGVLAPSGDAAPSLSLHTSTSTMLSSSSSPDSSKSKSSSCVTTSSSELASIGDGPELFSMMDEGVGVLLSGLVSARSAATLKLIPLPLEAGELFSDCLCGVVDFRGFSTSPESIFVVGRVGRFGTRCNLRTVILAVPPVGSSMWDKQLDI